MTTQRMLAGLLTLLLAACLPGPVPVDPGGTSSPTPLPGALPTDAPPTPTPSPTPTPEVRVTAGDRALFNGDYALAQSEYQLALATASDPALQAVALWGLARADYQAGNLGRAQQDLWQLINGHPDDPASRPAYFLLGEIYMQLERYAEAAQAYTVYVTLRPGVLDGYVHERRGDALSAVGDYAEAVAAYQAARAAIGIGSDISLQVKIARAHDRAGESITALEMYDAIAAATANEYTKAQMDLLSGQIYLAAGQTDLAYERFLHAVDNYPLSYDSYSALVALVNAGVPVNELNRGLVNYFAGQYGFALDAFRRYINQTPDGDGTAQYYSALALRNMGSHQEAADEFSAFIVNFPNNRNWQSAWDEKAYTQWAFLGQHEAAAQTLLDYSQAAPGSAYIPQTLLSAGRIYERAGRLDEAARTWDGIADAYPGSELAPRALFWAGIARYRDGKFDQALVTFQRGAIFSTLLEEQARAHFWTGKSYQALGDTPSAQAAWQQAAALDSTGYYSLRAQDLLFGRPVFEPPPAVNLTVDLAAERAEAEAWMRVTFSLPAETDLSSPGTLSTDPRFVRGTELWAFGLYDEARLEFENLRASITTNPAECYRLANYLLDLGLYRPAIFATRQVLTLAGMTSQLQTLAAPRYFNHIRYGLYYQDLVLPAAGQHGFDPLFLYAVMRQESLFEGFVRSTAGARGLMQIIPSTGQYLADTYGWPPDYTASDLYRPIVSVNLGVQYLKNNRVYFDEDLYAALAAYNAGPGNAEVWRGLSGPDPDLFLEVVRFEETRNYIRSIYEIFWMYRLLYETTP